MNLIPLIQELTAAAPFLAAWVPTMLMCKEPECIAGALLYAELLAIRVCRLWFSRMVFYHVAWERKHVSLVAAGSGIVYASLIFTFLLD
ncbi:hypothetical protein BDW72DRAFT_170759 [Aspergillus terricola var. indicus]